MNAPWPVRVRVVVLLLALACPVLLSAAGVDDEDEQAELARLAPDALARRACTLCHQFPDPSMLTKQNWREQILPRMSAELGVFPPDYSSSPEGELLRARRIYPDAPRIPKELWPKIEKYFLDTAPDVALPQPPHADVELGLTQFQVEPPRFRQDPPTTTLVKISPATHRIFVGDDHAQKLSVLDANGNLLQSIPLGNTPTDVTETERGLYVTCIGSFIPSEYYRAEFKFIPREGDKFGAPRTLLKDLPRSVQAQFADFNGDGLEDFVLCMYGNRTGRFSWFENRGKDQYVEHVLIEHSGAMYCHVRDFNGDGKPDLAVLLAQELEMLTLFLNDGKGEFSGQIVFQKPPVFGHSWFEPVDFNKDGRWDFIVVNGDNGEYDSPTKNYHGIRLLLNEGDLQFREVFFYPLNGAYKALARDFDGDGDLDIAAISYFPDYKNTPRESFVYLENLGDLKFKATTFPQCITGRWLVMDAADLDGDGAVDIVLGSHIAGPKSVPSFLMNLWRKQAAPILILHNRLLELKGTCETVLDPRSIGLTHAGASVIKARPTLTLGSDARVKQIAQYQDGRIELQDVPTPTAPPGGVLVRVTHSVISSGTEKMKVAQAKMNLLQKARARPDQVRKVMEVARNLGWRAALEKVRNRLESPSPLGYSAAGVVVAVDPLNTRFRVGDRVACGGAECAYHAEYIATPDLLTALVPEPVPNWQAAYTTLCSIAMQSVRQTEPRLGDRVLVLGQGLVGLLITNLLQAAGARVMAVDLLPARRSFCEAMGAERTVILGAQNLPDEVRAWTDSYGVDAVVLCTATDSNTPVEQAAAALRDRGRIVVVGITKVELPWRTFSEKELEVRYSRSYGPGRYDPTYEWGGSDYPIGFVRWTEQRNFDAVLHLMSKGQLHLDALTTRRVPFADALAVYQTLTTDSKDIGIILEYPGAAEANSKAEAAATRTSSAAAAETPQRLWDVQPRPGLVRGGGRIASPVSRLDVVGAGNFARTMLLPHLKDRLAFGTIVNQTALSARHVQAKFGFEKAATDASELLKSGDESSAVLIATRHHLHAPLTKLGLERNRHVFVEKPLCLSMDELREIDAAYEKSQGTVQVGFNRRFAPASTELKQALVASPGPKSASFRINAGKLDPQHWYANFGESGGRVLGEACHFLDYFCFIFNSDPVRVFAQTTWPASGRQPYPDSVAAQIEFADGSTGQLLYSGEGDPKFPKEMFSLYAAGLVAEITNYQELTLYRGRQKKHLTYNSKGHAEQMAAWQAFLRGERDHPFPYSDARRSMLLTFAVLESIQAGGAVQLRPE